MNVVHDARVAADALIFAYRLAAWREESKIVGLKHATLGAPLIVLAALVLNNIDEEVSPE